MMPRILFLLLLVSLVTSCAPKSDPGSYAQSRDFVPHRLHGKFCGPGYPKLSATSKEDELRQLKALRPVDLLDKACKIHDICYLQLGSSNASCDAELLENVEKITPYMSASKRPADMPEACASRIRLVFGFIDWNMKASDPALFNKANAYLDILSNFIGDGSTGGLFFERIASAIGGAFGRTVCGYLHWMPEKLKGEDRGYDKI